VTSRAQILAAARELIERDGWEKLTIRRLAAEVGIGPTTLYHHVRDKEDLQVLLVTEYAEQIPHPDLPSEPRERIIAAAMAFHDALAAWPWIAEVVTTDGFIGRVGESALSLVDTMVAGAIDYGCTPDQAIQVFRNIWYYTAGEILVRAHTARRWVDGEFPRDPDSPFYNADPARMPGLAVVASRWGEVAQQDHYLQGLRAFVDGLLAQAVG
jgi:AcrR family transcriptional regulator